MCECVIGTVQIIVANDDDDDGDVTTSLASVHIYFWLTDN